MAQHDYVLDDQAGLAFRADLNAVLAAIVGQNSGATEPATMYAYQWWADTTTGLLKIRNAANDAWITVGTLASAGLGLVAANGTVPMTGLLTMAASSDIASAATVDLTAATGNTTRITGTDATSAFTMTAGQWHMCIADGAWPLTYHATTNKLNTGTANYTCAAGDRVLLHKDDDNIIHATVLPTASPVAAASQAEMEAGTEAALRSMSPLRVAQAIAALSGLTSGTAQSLSSSGVAWKSIPSGTNLIIVSFYAASTNGTNVPVVQLGTGGSATTSGYTSLTINGSGTLNSKLSSGFPLTFGMAAAGVLTGVMLLTRANGNVWNYAVVSGRTNDDSGAHGAGTVSLAGELDYVGVAVATDSFDAGTANILYM